MVRLKVYTRVCPYCEQYHETTTRSHKAVCQKCKDENAKKNRRNKKGAGLYALRIEV